MIHSIARSVAFSLSLLLLAWSCAADSSFRAPAASEQSYLYKVSFARAAPGRLLDLIALMKNRMSVFDAAGDERPLWWRHTQGDQWDLMLIFPMGGYAEYYSSDRLAKRRKAEQSSSLPGQDFTRNFSECTAWQEDIFVMGPQLDTVKKAFDNAAYYHIEIFIALPGKQMELLKEREMENAYQVGIGRPENLIFTRDQGAAWDLFTLGCYRDLKHWAESSDVPREKREAAARAAGFAGPDAIGPYMRTLIAMHRDTMGVAIR